MDAQGRYRLAARAGQDELTSLDLFDRGAVRTSLAAGPEGNVSLSMIGADRHAASGLYLEPSGSKGLGFRQNGQGMTLGIDRDGSSRLFLTDKEGRDLGGFVSTADGELRPSTHPGAEKRTSIIVTPKLSDGV